MTTEIHAPQRHDLTGGPTTPKHNLPPSITDLLAAPIIRDAQDITWYAGGAVNTYLVIQKLNGQLRLQAYECNGVIADEKIITLAEFDRRCPRRPNTPGPHLMSEDLSRNHFAIAQLASCHYDAWQRNDWTVCNAAIDLFAQHVPSVAHAFERAKTIPAVAALPKQDLRFATSNALCELKAIKALSFPPNSSKIMDPWFRAQQLVRIASLVQRVLPGARDCPPKLYALESESVKSFLLVATEKTTYCGRFNLWLDGKMRPLLIDYQINGQAIYLENEENRWELNDPYPATVSEWNDAAADMTSMKNINTAPFDSLMTGAIRALSPQENMDAIIAWSANAQPMAAWDNIDKYGAIFAMGRWALTTWKKENADHAKILSSFVPDIQPEGLPSQLDAWRELVAASAPQKKPIIDPVDIDFSWMLSGNDNPGKS